MYGIRQTSCLKSIAVANSCKIYIEFRRIIFVLNTFCFFLSQVFVHSPYGYPKVINGAYVPFSKRKELNMKVSVVHTYSTSDVRSVDLSTRRCVFPDEVKLKLSENYHQDTCYFECRIEYLRNRCNCTPYFYPRLGKQPCNQFHF